MKLNRLRQHCQRLRDDLDRPIARVSEASRSLINYSETTRDPLVPSVWGSVRPAEDPFATSQGAGSQGGCCEWRILLQTKTALPLGPLETACLLCDPCCAVNTLGLTALTSRRFPLTQAVSPELPTCTLPHRLHHLQQSA